MTRRTQKVNELLRQEMSRVIQLELRDPRLRPLISVTRVDTSEDLRHSRVSVSVLGSSSQRDDALLGLTSAAGYIRKELGDALPLRHVPSLTFVLDDSLERSEAIGRVISGLSHPDSPAKQEESTDAPAGIGGA